MVTSADLALMDGNILTMNASQPYAEAVAIKDGRILKVGTNDAVSQLIGENTKIIHLKGKTVVPGFIDAHIHVADFGRLLGWLDLAAMASIQEMQLTLKKRVESTPKGKWIIGKGWDQTRFAEQRLPTRFDLDVASPENPVIFYHKLGQMCVVNSKALELAGVTKQTTKPAEGSIAKDTATGELTGILQGTAMNLVWKAIPEPSEEELAEAVALACGKIVKVGITSVHWIVLSAAELAVMQRLLAQNKLPMRVYLIIPATFIDNVADFKVNDNLSLRIGGVMITVDGYLASKTAALFQPYNNGSESGIMLCTRDEIVTVASRILKMNLQPVLHAMGDRAVDAALTAIEQMSEEPLRKLERIRIEHAAVLNKELIDRMKKLGVVVSVQPLVIASEFSAWSALENLGVERARWLYPLKTLLENGIRVIGGSDCPMEPLNPLMGIQAAVLREVFPEENVTVEEALRMYTVDAAYAAGEENFKGSIETGKLADLTVLSHDPRRVHPTAIANIAVQMTIVGGKIICSKIT
ncbi:MAG: amidohydrolase [Candidatus Bathyarchaeota archaeon]|nr:amidohydrolase [Candidatus Bathyarchaeota archaeon]